MTDRKIKIAIDIDDVIADTNQTIRLWSNRVSGVELPPEHYSVKGEYWSYYNRIWATHNIDDRLNFDDFEAELIEDQAQVPLIASASLSVKELLKKYDIVLITSRNPALEAGTRRWIDEQVSPDVEIFFAKNPSISVGKSKGQLCKELGVSILIDDNEDHCQSALDNGVKAVMFGKYGWQTTVPDGAIPCEDWPAVLEYLNDAA